MWLKILKGFFDSDTEIEDNTCNHEDYYEGPSTTRVVLILASTALIVGAIGYALRPIADIVRELYDDPDIPNGDNKGTFKDNYITVQDNKIKLAENNN